MTKTLKVNKNVQESMIELLRSLLDKGKVKGIFTLKKISNDGAVAYALVTQVDELQDAVPFFPLMPSNAGKLLSRLTLQRSTSESIAAVIRPCELRAFIELVKLEQAHLENIFFISSTCAGVYPLKMVSDGSVEKNLSKYWSMVDKGEIPDDLRAACKACEEFIPYTADITVDVVGNGDVENQCFIFLNTHKAEELVNGISDEFIEKDLDQEMLDAYREKRTAAKEKLFDEIDSHLGGVDGLLNIFGKCIGCHGCSKVCPICYCKLCEFESIRSESKSAKYEAELAKKGGVRTPLGTLYYHLGRLDHISISCVGCGSCEDVCPVDIPLSIVFKKVGESVQCLFDYLPGRDINEEIPLKAFEEEEFAEAEE